MPDQDTEQIELEGEVVGEENAPVGEASTPVTALARKEASALPVLSDEARTAALAVAGGALAGAATVAAVRAIGSAGKRSRGPGRRLGRRRRSDNVVASRSFLVDVHVLGR